MKYIVNKGNITNYKKKKTKTNEFKTKKNNITLLHIFHTHTTYN